jgi:hypothetical protein
VIESPPREPQPIRPKEKKIFDGLKRKRESKFTLMIALMLHGHGSSLRFEGPHLLPQMLFASGLRSKTTVVKRENRSCVDELAHDSSDSENREERFVSVFEVLPRKDHRVHVQISRTWILKENKKDFTNADPVKLHLVYVLKYLRVCVCIRVPL